TKPAQLQPLSLIPLSPGADAPAPAPPINLDPATALVELEPGAYRDPAQPARRIVVTPAVDAANVAEPAPAQAARFFDAYGPWTSLPADAAAGEAWVDARKAPAPFGWEILWIVLALVVFEAWVARWVSHATRGEGAPLLKQIFGHLRGGDAQVENRRDARDRAPTPTNREVA
ncbi:MAG: hypothetical protein AAGA57_02720, partial [Planctomycetota bacterium]